MLHTRLVFVSLLAPSLSFASTATDSLSGTTRDVFDNLDENPAFVNVEGGKSYLRIGKSGGMQLLTTAGGYGLGIQVNTTASTFINHLDRNSKELSDAATALMKKGMPIEVSLGDDAGGLKWGAGLQYENAKLIGEAATATFDPRFVKLGLSLGFVKDETQVSLKWGRDTWKIGTSGKTKGANGNETPTYLPAGMNEQSTDSLGGLVRYTMGQYQWFLTGGRSATKAVFFSGGENGTTSNQDNMNKIQGFELGAERQDKLADNMTLFSKGWLSWATGLGNGTQKKVETTDIQLSTGHGLEFAAASWVSLRAGVQASIYGNRKTTTTLYADLNQSGTSGANTTDATYMLRVVDLPTMGVGFKFGQFAIDATLGQDGTGNLGFSDNLLGKVEVTGQF